VGARGAGPQKKIGRGVRGKEGDTVRNFTVEFSSGPSTPKLPWKGPKGVVRPKKRSMRLRKTKLRVMGLFFSRFNNRKKKPSPKELG